MGNLHLDEPTGEMVRYESHQLSFSVFKNTNHLHSKSELKKRQKQRTNEEKKREKAAAAPPKAEKQRSAEEEESNLTPNVRGQPLQDWLEACERLGS